MPKPPTMQNGSPDNFQTDPKALDCLIPYLKKEWTIWECAVGKGNLLRGLHDHGLNVFGTDKKERDFLLPFKDGEVIINFDCIVTNPPFSLKEEFLGRCYQIGKPFALLMPVTTFDSKDRRKSMAQFGIEVVLPPGRINFETPNHEQNIAAGKRTRSWFYTAWFTWGLNIGRQLTFCDDAQIPGL